MNPWCSGSCHPGISLHFGYHNIANGQCAPITPGILLCVKTKCMNMFIVDCSRYLFWFHIINQSGNALLTIQSEEVTSSSHFLFVDIPHWPISAHFSSCRSVSLNRLLAVYPFMLMGWRFGCTLIGYLVPLWILMIHNGYSNLSFPTLLIWKTVDRLIDARTLWVPLY